MIFHQLNVREIDKEIELIQELKKDSKNFLIGLEITLPEISQQLTINIDPQHNWGSKDKSTCIEKTYESLSYLEKYKHKVFHVFFLKTDLDSISSAAIIDIVFNDKISINNDMLKRIKAIANYDRHGRKYASFNERKIPRGLFMFISGWKNTIIEKIETAKSWIITDTFEDCYRYNKIAFKNFKEFIFSSKIDIIKPKQIVFVRSIRRGACGLGYKIAPIVIALNPSYRYGFGDSRLYGKKWIIAQQHEGFIDMGGLLKELKLIEPKWGGSSTIIGSPQDRPSKITKNEILELVQKYTYGVKNERAIIVK